ncbi:10577_t:CDS:1, partial [Funneliformis caledonium]
MEANLYQYRRLLIHRGLQNEHALLGMRIWSGTSPLPRYQFDTNTINMLTFYTFLENTSVHFIKD